MKGSDIVLLEMKDISLSYDEGKEYETVALNNINIRFNKNQLTVITGPSGGGKSSLLYVLSGMRKPASGEVVYQGESLYQMSRDKRANLRKQKIGFIFQRHFLIDYLSVIDNIMLMSSKNVENQREKAMVLLKKLELESFVNKCVFQLSVGQRQRVAIIRALISEPDIILADEPTASLDEKISVQVMEILKEYSKKAAVLIVTHDMELLNYAQRIVEIKNAEIVKDELLH